MDFLFTADSTRSAARPSKVRGAALPQEYELSVLIQEIEITSPTWSTATSACEWDGVQCDSLSKVTDLIWHRRRLAGKLKWDYLPRTLETIYVQENELSGGVNLCGLPFGILLLHAAKNRFSGQLDFSSLPPNIKRLYLNDNLFSGEIKFDSLPKDMIMLYLQDNAQLSGKIERANLPRLLHSNSDLFQIGTRITVV
mmetsp:Transcript_22827/g.31320  ORF Transcript_22827/g.31320 Transcript_22827/m.31320 type:complete len:197 (+) Transcript_22827:53-643(+)|eukprot:CAMPEP_0201480184 /NCGR_PEP_ID=MMETSP0151_2-20130828/4718_1 /ASSEMBLY_ACC=CAM_ASM_000257 /TAXON_ID=200890 /ORGANISM="Paramoeba atlantica, Strain 621/1 / CCAP 1560/9" /LENGTH=196 /DNA_ID=CAMNT_0047861963 /DNA_START=53 /DNA_END=643 /DNA_ORIENTATION=-